MDYRQEEKKGRILRKVWFRQKERKKRKNTKESMDRKKGRKGRILMKVQIERTVRKNTEESMDYRKKGRK